MLHLAKEKPDTGDVKKHPVFGQVLKKRYSVLLHHHKFDDVLLHIFQTCLWDAQDPGQEWPDLEGH